MTTATILETYVSDLKAFDWTFEWCSDGDVWRRSNDALKVLRELQVRLDPNFCLWNLYADKGYRVKPHPMCLSAAANQVRRECCEQAQNHR